MLRPLSLLPALVATVGLGSFLLTGIAVPAPAVATPTRLARAADDAPLAVSIDSLTPSVLPRSGKIQISGEITNLDDETWTAVNVYPFISAAPMTTQAELAAAAEVDAEVDVGERITEPGPYDTIDTIAPGETVPYSFTIRRKRLPVDNEPGVYWFGVHALGAGPEGRVDGADGRARTFLPLVPDNTTSVDTALVVPVRRAIQHRADGSIGGVASWAHTLDRGGHLRTLVEFGAAAGSRPISWLIDPAVPDAVQALVDGNQPRSLAPTVGDGDSPDDDASDAATPSESASPTQEPEDDSTSPADPDLQAAATAGAAWLDRLHSALEGSEILSLPYGDVDVAAAAAHSARTYRDARDRAGTELEPWGLPTTPTVSSPGGYLSPEAVRLVDPGTTALVTDQALGDSPATVADADGRTVVATSSGALEGGPGPDDPLGEVALRQRILSEAAMRALSRGREPLVVVFPGTWRTSSPTDFFAGLDVPWMHLTTVDSIAGQGGTTITPEELRYPEAQKLLELDAADFAAASDLAHSGDVLQNLLTLNNQVAATVRDEAFTDVSYLYRAHPFLGRTSAVRSRMWIEERLRSVHVEAPRAVILSSGSGRFSATLRNELDEPVTVRLDAITEPPLRVSVPKDTVRIAAGSRTTVLLNASSSAPGIRNVRLLLSDTDGVSLGSYEDVPIRSNRVSNVIWLIVGTGIALLFGAILVRLVRQLRSARKP